MKEIKRKTQIFDAAEQTVGRLSTKIAIALRGKDKPEFQPHLDIGDIVEVTNVDRLKFTGKKLEQKKYYHYSGYPGGLKETKMSDVFKNDPGDILKRAVRKMLPDNRLRKDMLKRLIIK
ncbi:MAG: 50S ribosomal protein L13 [bacterium]